MTFRQATAHLNRREKAGYIWDYYKLPIFAAVIAVCIVLSFLVHALTKKDTALSIAFINISMSTDSIDALTSPYIKSLPGGAKKYEIPVQRFILSSDASDSDTYEYSYASSVKLLAMITARDLDVVFMSTDCAEDFIKKGYIKESIPLEDTDFFRKTGLSAPICAGIIDNSERKKQAEAFIKGIK